MAGVWCWCKLKSVSRSVGQSVGRSVCQSVSRSFGSLLNLIVFFFTLAGSLSTDYLYTFLSCHSFSLVGSFLPFFLAAPLSSFHVFSITSSNTSLALIQLSYYTKFPRHVYFAILRCAHFATPCLNSVLLRN